MKKVQPFSHIRSICSQQQQLLPTTRTTHAHTIRFPTVSSSHTYIDTYIYALHTYI